MDVPIPDPECNLQHRVDPWEWKWTQQEERLYFISYNTWKSGPCNFLGSNVALTLISGDVSEPEAIRVGGLVGLQAQICLRTRSRASNFPTPTSTQSMNH